MGLDLSHFKVIKEDEQTLFRPQEFNVVDFPEEFKAKFKDYLYYQEVEYIDWRATFQKLMQLSFEEFYERYDQFMETSEGVYHFCTKDCDNPWDDPQKFAIHVNQCETLKQNDPHIKATCEGYQRGCMREEFYKTFDHNQAVIDESVVKSMSKMCDGPECVENFIEQFILNWTDRSFVHIDY